jgi:hypothetical protein
MSDIENEINRASRAIASLRNISRRPRRRGKRRISRTAMNKYWTWGPDELNFPELKKQSMNNNLFIGLSDLNDHTVTSLLQGQMKDGINTVVDNFSVLATREKWNEFLFELNDVQLTQMKGRYGVVNFREKSLFFTYSISSSDVEVEAYGSDIDVKWVTDWIRDQFEEVLTEIEWIYGADGSSIQIPLRADRHPVSEMYPFLGDETLEKYYERYMESSASILLLIGPPGTGKTSFIRGLMQHTQSSAIVTYDENIMSKDYVFANFIEGDKNLMVIEDADMFLKARSEGNTTMHKFLNVGDGLVTTRNKKLIFSTNLPSIRDIDPALIRPGRCFDIVTFDLLDQQAAEKLAKKMNVTLTETKDKWNIADIFNKQTFDPHITTKRTTMGFV